MKSIVHHIINIPHGTCLTNVPSAVGLVPAIFLNTLAETLGAPKGVKSVGRIPRVEILIERTYVQILVLENRSKRIAVKEKIRSEKY